MRASEALHRAADQHRHFVTLQARSRDSILLPPDCPARDQRVQGAYRRRYAIGFADPGLADHSQGSWRL